MKSMCAAVLAIAMTSCATNSESSVEGIPHPEHPRPDFHRQQWLNLNGQWQFDFDPTDAGRQEGWFNKGGHEFLRTIMVPFPWEAKLSGIGDTDYRGVAWYARTITIPKKWRGNRVWLCFGAVDWSAEVWVDGKRIGEHEGGYTPFSFDITSCAEPGREVYVVVRAEDHTSPEQPTGKQTGWYTRTSGIWQTVYLETRGAAYLDRVELHPRLHDDNKKATVAVRAYVGGRREGASVRVSFAGQSVELPAPGADGVCTGTVEVAGPRLWSPDDPHLYDAEFRVSRDGKEEDRVLGYVGVREVTTAAAPGRDYKYICLNGKPVYLRGALHQSFHPDGIYQYPDDKMARWDYEYAKRIGLNFLRIHIKTEIPRALYWADKLGVLIMEDQPNFSHYTDRSKKNWESVLRETVARDFNHPCIFSWCNFNETWGIGHGGYKPDHQLWVKDMYELTRRLDPTRLVEDNSPCRYDHVITDINSWHFYINSYHVARKHIENVVKKTYPGSSYNYARGYQQADAPLINSEYGGISAGMGDQDISWCFKYLTNELRKHDKVCGYVYTEQSDIEWEHNGFLNYDRTEKVYGYDFWFPGFGLADLNAPDFVVLDMEPCPVVKPGTKLTAPVLISHWSERLDTELTLHWRLDVVDRFGKRQDKVASGSRAVKWESYRVVPAGGIEVEVPETGPAVGALCVWLANGQDEKLAANYMNVYVRAESPRLESVGKEQLALRFSPDEFCDWQWAGGGSPPLGKSSGNKVFAHGSGFVSYEIAIPDGVSIDRLSGLQVMFEASAKAGDEKLSWPARKKPLDYPQTDKESKWPTEVAVRVNDAEVIRKTLIDDPADARGVLSHVFHFHPGSFGWLVEATLNGRDHAKVLDEIKRTRRIRITVGVPEDAKSRGGLALFGQELGRYCMDPTVVLTFDGPHGLAADHKSMEPVTVNRLVSRRKVVVPTAETQPHSWRYTTKQPPTGWEAADFDDVEWSVGKGGFGRAGTPNAIINTRWHTSDIWLRTRFNAPDSEDLLGGILRVYHDEDIEVYLNAEKVAERRGYVTDYVDIELKAEQLKLLTQKGNVLAVHCRQTVGGQNVDVGLFVFLAEK